MFWSAASFNTNISKWDVSSVTNMKQMFKSAASFNQQLCGTAWVRSKATKREMFIGSSGSILSTGCRAFWRQRWLARWLATSTPGITMATTTCPNCGTFKKSGRVSCCAPGGAWYKNCGGTGNRNFGHSWVEGVEACKRKSNASSFRYIQLH